MGGGSLYMANTHNSVLTWSTTSGHLCERRGKNVQTWALFFFSHNLVRSEWTLCPLNSAIPQTLPNLSGYTMCRLLVNFFCLKRTGPGTAKHNHSEALWIVCSFCQDSCEQTLQLLTTVVNFQLPGDVLHMQPEAHRSDIFFILIWQIRYSTF